MSQASSGVSEVPVGTGRLLGAGRTAACRPMVGRTRVSVWLSPALASWKSG